MTAVTRPHRHGDRDPHTSVFLARLAETESVTVGGSIVPKTESLWTAVLYRKRSHGGRAGKRRAVLYRKRSHCGRQCCTGNRVPVQQYCTGNRVTVGGSVVPETDSLCGSFVQETESLGDYCTGNRVTVDGSVVPETESLWASVLYRKRSYWREYCTGN